MVNINNTEEQLYNQFMAELEEGANEYDRMMAEGKAPAFKASMSNAIIVSMVRWAAIAACFVGMFTGGYFYFLNNTDSQQLAFLDKPTQKVKYTKENNTAEQSVTEKTIAVLPEETKNVRKFNVKKNIDVKEKDDYECFLPDVVLNVPNTVEEDGNTAQYPNIRKEYDFDVICYNVLPEISDSDNMTLIGSGIEIKHICDNIYYNDIKPLKHSQQ